MSLSTAQLATLKTDIQSRPALWANGTQQVGNEQVAAFYNGEASPAVPVWKPVVTIKELNSKIDWPELAALTEQKQLAFQTMIWMNSIDMTDPQVRQGIDTIFGNPSTTRTGIIAIGKKNATYLEALFSTGTGTKTSQVFGASLSPEEVSAAING